MLGTKIKHPRGKDKMWTNSSSNNGTILQSPWFILSVNAFPPTIYVRVYEAVS